MDVAIIFEVSERTDDVRTELIIMGYYNSWQTSSGDVKTRYGLPNNMVWKRDITFQDAINNIKLAINNINHKIGGTIVLQKCITLSTTPWDGVPS